MADLASSRVFGDLTVTGLINGDGSALTNLPSAGGSSVTISETAPPTPSAGDMWWDSAIAKLFVYYEDVDSAQWVAATPTTTVTADTLGLGTTAYTDLGVLSSQVPTNAMLGSAAYTDLGVLSDQVPTNAMLGSAAYVDTSSLVSSVNGSSGVVVLTKDDVGLNNVDNTSDLNKPVSTATQTSIDQVAGSITGKAIAMTIVFG